MIRGVRRALQGVVAASTSCWLLVAAQQLAAGQMVRPPDVGVWFKQERSPDGMSALVVSDLLADGSSPRPAFAKAIESFPQTASLWTVISSSSRPFSPIRWSRS